MNTDTPTPVFARAHVAATVAVADDYAARNARRAAEAAEADARDADASRRFWATVCSAEAAHAADAARVAAEDAEAVAACLREAYVDQAATHATVCALYGAGTVNAWAAADDAAPHVRALADALGRLHDAATVADAEAARRDVARRFGAVCALAHAATHLDAATVAVAEAVAGGAA
jgi:hypothetical protein